MTNIIFLVRSRLRLHLRLPNLLQWNSSPTGGKPITKKKLSINRQQLNNITLSTQQSKWTNICAATFDSSFGCHSRTVLVCICDVFAFIKLVPWAVFCKRTMQCSDRHKLHQQREMLFFVCLQREKKTQMVFWNKWNQANRFIRSDAYCSGRQFGCCCCCLWWWWREEVICVYEAHNLRIDAANAIEWACNGMKWKWRVKGVLSFL